MQVNASELEIAAYITIPLSQEMASALAERVGESSSTEFVKSLLERSADEDKDKDKDGSEVGEPPEPEELPIVIDIPPMSPKEPVEVLKITIDVPTLKWLLARARKENTSVTQLVMHLFVEAIWH